MTLRRDRKRGQKKSPNPANFQHPLCMNGCGERGPHFVGPSFGDRGFFICEPKPIDLTKPPVRTSIHKQQSEGEKRG